MENPLRHLPSVGQLLDSPPLRYLIDRVSRSTVVSTVRKVLDELRQEAVSVATTRTMPSVTELAERIARRVRTPDAPELRPLINATGAVFDGRFGGPPLADDALSELAALGHDFANLELDLPTGRATRPASAVESLLSDLCGAESVTVMHTQAAALWLSLAALAAGREVIVSRGELAEVAGAYRIPDLIAASGARIREVGTTNSTRAADYAAALTPETAAIVVVSVCDAAPAEPSSKPDLAELTRLAHDHRVPLIHDLGRGGLVSPVELGFPDEPTLAATLKAGADLVILGGDKLLGGPACGILAGRRALIDTIERHGLAPIARTDKIILAALIGTLRLWRDPEKARQALPLWQMLTASEDNLRQRAERLAPQMAAVPAIAEAAAVSSSSAPLGGSSPAVQRPTWCVALKPARMSLEQLAARLRSDVPAVIGRIASDRLLLDLRSVRPRQDLQLVVAIEGLSGRETPAA